MSIVNLTRGRAGVLPSAESGNPGRYLTRCSFGRPAGGGVFGGSG
ncbi:MAG: hypothetical protein XXXNARYT_000943 [Candidatus Accumulibacter regalis]